MDGGQDQPVEVTENHDGQDQPVEVTEIHGSEIPGECLLWLWDAFDLTAFVLWTWLYKDHVSNDDRSSFLIISWCVVLPGFYLLLRAVYNSALEKAQQKCPCCASYLILILMPVVSVELVYAAVYWIPVFKTYLDGTGDGFESFLDWLITGVHDHYNQLLVGVYILLYVARINTLLGWTAKVNVWRVSKGYETFSMNRVIREWFSGYSLFAVKGNLDIIRRRKIDPSLDKAAKYLTNIRGMSDVSQCPSEYRRILQQEYLNWEIKSDKRRRSQHIYAEILYDVIQAAVMAWVMSEVKLKDDHFPFKLFADFLNLATTCGDLFLLKGPQAFNMVLENAGAEGFGKALLAELKAFSSEGDENMYSTAVEVLKVKCGVNFSLWVKQQYFGTSVVSTLLPGLDEWIRFKRLEAAVNNLERERLIGPEEP